LLLTQMFPCLPARVTFVMDTNFGSGTQKKFPILFSNVVSPTNVSQFAQPKKHHEQQDVRNNVSSFTRALTCSRTEEKTRWPFILVHLSYSGLLAESQQQNRRPSSCLPAGYSHDKGEGCRLPFVIYSVHYEGWRMVHVNASLFSLRA